MAERWLVETQRELERKFLAALVELDEISQPFTASGQLTTIAPLRANQSNVDLPINVMPFLCIAQS